MTDKLLYNVQEAVQVLGICRTRIFKLMAQGELRSVRIGTSRRIPAAALVEYVERLQQQEQEAS